MNILYLNHYAGSPELGMEYRPYYLAREWVRAGHRVQIVAADHSHVRTLQPAAGDQVVDGIHYRWIGTPAYQGNGLGRVRNIWTFLRKVWRDTHRLVREFEPDIVIASSTYPMDIWVARRIARRARARLVYEVHDLWPLSPMEVAGMSRHHLFIRLVQWAEDTAYRDADVVVSMLPKVHDYMASRGLDLRKLHIVPNGVAPDDWSLEAMPLRADVAAAFAAARAAQQLVVGYAGSMGRPNALEVLLDAAALMQGEPVRFVLVGDGLERAALAEQARRLPNVAMLAPVPKAMIPGFLAAIDIAYIGWRRAPTYRFGIAPNKLMDYMMAGCTVLHSVQAGNDPVAESGCGLSVAPQDPAAVAAGLRELAALGPDERRTLGERGRDFVQAHHTYPVLARHFLEALA